jgi:hypothetical protein
VRWSLLLLLAGCDSGGGAADNFELVDLGKFTTDADGLVNIPWEAPEGVVSTEVFCGPYGYDTIATADDLSSPDGTVVFDDEAPYDGAMRVGVLDDLLPVLVPVSPSLPAVAGTWSMNFFIDAAQLPATVSCGSLARTGDVGASNAVDVHIVFVGVDGISAGMTAQAAESDDTVQSVIAGLDTLWSDLGLRVGNVRYSDFAGDTASATTIEGYEEFGNLLRTVDDEPALTFFFVQDIELGDGASILGLSGGPPGVAGHGGTSKSGVVINVANVGSSPEQVSLIMAHEGGHFLGLFHPTELDVSLAGVDPLDDTPECADSDGDGSLTSAECEGSGAENVMWPTAQAGTATTFSGDQSWVVARNLIVYPD